MIADRTNLSVSPIMRNVAALAVAQCITWAASTVAIVLLPHYLGSANLGKYALAYFCAGILNIAADVGVGTYLTKQIPREGYDGASRLAWNAVGLALVASTALTLVAAICVHLLVADPTTRAIYFISLLAVPLQGIYTRISSSLRGAQEMTPLARAEGVSRCIYVTLIAYLLMTGHGVQAICAAGVLAVLLSIVLSAMPFMRRFRYVWPATPSTWKLLAVGGLPFLVWQASLQIYGQIDILILSLMSSDSAVGWYATAYRLIGVPVFAPAIIVGAVFPALSAAAANPSRITYIAVKALRACLIITVPMSFGMAVLSARIPGLLDYPADFNNIIAPVSILALHVPIVGVTMIIATCLYAIEKHWSWVKVGIAAAVLNPVMNIPLIYLTESLYDNGAIGAAFGTLLTEVLMLCLGIALLPRWVLGRSAVEHGFRTCLAGLVMVLVIFPLRQIPLAAVVAAGAVVYSLALFALKAISLDECGSLLRQLRRRVVMERRTA
jgi:O-antigen/teichoic acid export membrane protein